MRSDVFNPHIIKENPIEHGDNNVSNKTRVYLATTFLSIFILHYQSYQGLITTCLNRYVAI